MRTRRNSRRRPAHPGAMRCGFATAGHLQDAPRQEAGLSRYQLSQILAERRFSHERNGFEAGVRCGRVGAIVDGNGGGLR